MKLINVSTGKVQTIQVGSEVIRTAHIKTAMPQPWVIGPNGAEGDERASHHDQIYALGRRSYEYWGKYLRIDPNKWPDGFFGENLTLDEMDERDLRVGDVYALGAEVRLVVAGARTPCVKLAWRLSQPRSFQKVFALSRESGAYFGVLQGGVVRPGDELVRVHREADLPSVPDLCDWVASHSPPPLDPLRRLLAFERLSPTIRLLLGSKLDAAERAAALVEGRWRGWRSFTIARIEPEAPDICSFYLRANDGERLCQARPGQFVSVRMDGGQDTFITRSWSLSSFSPDPDHYRLTVRRQGGAGSNWLHAARPGAQLQLRAPTGEFALNMGGFRPVVLIAAGIGITPLFAMLEAHLSRSNPAPLFLIYGARTPGEMAFKTELDQIAATHAAIHIFYVYSRKSLCRPAPPAQPPSKGTLWAVGPGERDGTGFENRSFAIFQTASEDDRPATRITPQLVIDLLSGLYVLMAGHRVELPWYESEMYICGPGDFCATMQVSLIALGANPDQLASEMFVAPEAGQTDVDVAEILFVRSDAATVWHTDQDLTLLELAEKAGVEMDSDCRAGSCQTCRTRIVEGSTTADTADGYTLPCIAKPRTAVVRLDA